MPWDIPRTRRRRRLGQALLALWASSVLWVWAGLVARAPQLWLGPLAVYLVITGVAALVVYRDVRRCRCLACGHTWPVGGAR